MASARILIMGYSPSFMRFLLLGKIRKKKIEIIFFLHDYITSAERIAKNRSEFRENSFTLLLISIFHDRHHRDPELTGPALIGLVDIQGFL